MPRHHRTLAAVTLAGAAALVPTSAAAEPDNQFEMPFPCDEAWTGDTRSGHSPSEWSIDWNREGDMGDTVVASAGGTVEVADTSGGSGYGQWVQVAHPSDESTVYAHLSSVEVSEGEEVERGDPLGAVGSTGNSTGAHLHYEQREGSDVTRPHFGGEPFDYGSTQASENCGSSEEAPPPEEEPEPDEGSGSTDTNAPLAGDLALDEPDDLTVFRRQETGVFEVRRPGAENHVIEFGRGTDTPLLGDWDGDGQGSAGVYRPESSTFLLRQDGTTETLQFGQPGDVPVVGDWDGDGATDVGVRRGTTFLKRTDDGRVWEVELGDSDDVPVAGDWNQDGIADLGVYDAATSTFTLRILGTDWEERTFERQFGEAGSVPVVGDWDGNGATDLGVWDAETSTFHLRHAEQPTDEESQTEEVQFGQSQG